MGSLRASNSTLYTPYTLTGMWQDTFSGAHRYTTMTIITVSMATFAPSWLPDQWVTNISAWGWWWWHTTVGLGLPKLAWGRMLERHDWSSS